MHCHIEGVVAVRGGLLPEVLSSSSSSKHDTDTAGEGKEEGSPLLIICSKQDTITPTAHLTSTIQLYKRRYPSPATNIRIVVCDCTRDNAQPNSMISSAKEMQAVMEFYAAHLTLRNLELEGRADIVPVSMVQ